MVNVMENSKLKELLIKTDDAQWKYVDRTRKLDKCFLITMKEKRNQTQADVLTFCGLRFFILGTNNGSIRQVGTNQTSISALFTQCTTRQAVNMLHSKTNRDGQQSQ
ncbi:hypothetical protein FQA47_018187 [Oryzias melastigma]|uniref:Uncharacterized protein n=1 Tax=Oryzias melastigma TaxID=30732 RepID=A0A834BYD2_ORYME|nr:hypothetical protein FQA47_018187 [Oryzias melastigma]